MEIKIKHLEFIQNIITRQNTNSFQIKNWAIGILTGLLALSAANSNIKFILIAYVIIPVFWVLDAFYLSIERKFRDLYNVVLEKKETEIDFKMNLQSITNYSNSWIATFFSASIIVFYAACFGVVFLIMRFF